MGIVNVTPDSFFAHSADAHAATAHALALRDAGADILDIGGESSRPGAQPVSLDEELARVMPVIHAVRRADATVWISIDTTKARVAAAALEAGANMVNDISAGCADAQMLQVVAQNGASFVAMHMQGTPTTMQTQPTYGDIVAEVATFLQERAAAAQVAGVARERIMLDPGFGFGKTFEHNLQLVHGLSMIVALGYPVVVGVSRKAMIGQLLGGAPVQERLEGSLAVAARCVDAGARLVRVHDVAETRRFLQAWRQLR